MRTFKHLTTPEQSERLLELGLPSNSADFYYNCFMHLYPVPEEGYDKWVDGEDGFTPCWSVGQLIEIYTKIAGLGNLVVGRKPMESLMELYEENADLLSSSF